MADDPNKPQVTLPSDGPPKLGANFVDSVLGRKPSPQPDAVRVDRPASSPPDETVRQTVERTYAEVSAKEAQVKETNPDTPDPTKDHHAGKYFSLNNVVVFVASECFAVPLNIAAGEAFVAGHLDRAALGWGLGVPLAVAGFTFHWWKTWISVPARNSIQLAAKFGWPVALLAAVIYVAGPEMYRRATKPVAVSGAIGLMPIGSVSPDELISQATKKIAAERDEAVASIARASKERDDAIRNLEEMTRQRDAAIADAKNVRQQIPTPQQISSNPAQKGPIVWNLDSQFLVASSTGTSFEINGVLLQGTSTASVAFKEAYAVSGLTGHRQELMANVPFKGYYPVSKVDVPPQAPVQLDLVWNPGIPLKDFLDQWGKIRVVIAYADGTTYEHDFDEHYVREKLRQMIPSAFGPRVTPRE